MLTPPRAFFIPVQASKQDTEFTIAPLRSRAKIGYSPMPKRGFRSRITIKLPAKRGADAAAILITRIHAGY